MLKLFLYSNDGLFVVSQKNGYTLITNLISDIRFSGTCLCPQYLGNIKYKCKFFKQK